MQVRDLVKMLKKLDPDMDIQMTMNREYTSPIGALYVRYDTLVIDDVPVDLDLRFDRPANLIYNEFDEETV